MKQLSFTKQITLATLALAGTLFQSCGRPGAFTTVQASGNGGGYEGTPPSGEIGLTPVYAYHGVCADPTADEMVIATDDHTSYRLTVRDCRAVTPPDVIPAERIEVIDADHLHYEDHVFTRKDSP